MYDVDLTLSNLKAPVLLFAGGLLSYATNSQSILHLQILLCFSIECFLLPAFRRSMRSWLRQSFVPSWCKKPKV